MLPSNVINQHFMHDFHNIQIQPIPIKLLNPNIQSAYIEVVRQARHIDSSYTFHPCTSKNSLSNNFLMNNIRPWLKTSIEQNMINRNIGLWIVFIL